MLKPVRMRHSAYSCMSAPTTAGWPPRLQTRRAPAISEAMTGASGKRCHPQDGAGACADGLKYRLRRSCCRRRSRARTAASSE